MICHYTSFCWLSAILWPCLWSSKPYLHSYRPCKNALQISMLLLSNICTSKTCIRPDTAHIPGTECWSYNAWSTPKLNFLYHMWSWNTPFWIKMRWTFLYFALQDYFFRKRFRQVFFYYIFHRRQHDTSTYSWYYSDEKRRTVPQCFPSWTLRCLSGQPHAYIRTHQSSTRRSFCMGRNIILKLLLW